MDALNEFSRVLTASSFAFLPQIIVVSILYAVSSSKFDLSAPSSGDPRTLAGNRYAFMTFAMLLWP